MNKMNFGRRFKYGSMAILLSIVVIVAIIVVNIGATLLTERLGLEVDMTEDGRYAISDATVELVSNLKEKVYIYVVATEAEMRSHVMVSADGYQMVTYGDEIVEVLSKYPIISNGKISLEFVDVALNPQFLKQFDGIGTVDPYTVIVANEKGSYRTIPLYQLYYWYYSFDESFEQGVGPIGLHVERSIASGILFLDEDEKKTAVFVSGHGEPQDMMAFSDFLKLNNFECFSVNLNTTDIPEETDLVIIAAPTLDYEEAVIRKLEEYLAKPGSDMFVALSPANGDLPELKRFISDYGIDISNSTIFDTKVSAGAAYISALPSSEEEMFANLPYTTNIIMPLSLRLTMNEGRPTSYTARSILTSSDSSFAKANADVTQSLVVKEDGDVAGPFDVACIASHTVIDLSNYSSTNNNILVLGSAYSMYDEFFNSSKYTNQEFFTAILNDFFETPDLSVYEPNEFTVPEILLLNWEKTFVLSVLCIIPTALLFAGIFVWFRRKNK